MLRKLSAAAGLALFLSSAVASAQIDYRQLGAPLPPMRLVGEGGRVFTENDALPGENLFIMLFNPTCEHCHEATAMFGKNDSLFKDGQLYLMAGPAMLPYLEYFGNTTGHKKHPVIRVGVDSTGFIEKTFNYQSLPELLIYDRDRRLVHTISSSIPVDSLLPYLGPSARQYTGPVINAPNSVAPASGPFRVATPADEPKKKKRRR